jgi:hypothetical protein
MGYVSLPLSGAEPVSALFRVSADEPAPDTHSLFSSAIRKDPPARGTRALFYSDRNISDVVYFTVWDAKPIRNGNCNSSTALNRPDYGLLIKTHCVL